MRRYNPLVARPKPRFNPLSARDQAYTRLLLPAAGELTWTATNHIVAIYRINPPGFGPFALVRWPSTLLPLYVRDAGVRYTLNSNAQAADIYGVPYAGQVLTANAIFELWAAGEAPVTLPAYTLTISPRVQLACCCGDEQTTISAALYYPYCQPYPICLPICSAS